MTAPVITVEAAKAMRQHALDAYPQESCGFLADGAYVRLPNIAGRPEDAFRIDEAIWLEYEGRIEAVVHSHPVADCFNRKKYRPGCWPACPSADDMRGQLRTGVPWGIVVTNGNVAAEPFFWGDFLLDGPLEGVPFRHGVTDCYLAIRKWWWQARGVKLPEFPRDDGWWENGEDLYREGFEKAGFRRLKAEEPLQPGDVVLTKIRSQVLNHGAVYVGNGEVYHHLFGELSRVAAGGRRLSEATDRLRYEG